MKKWLYYCLLLTVPLVAEQKTTTVESEMAQYDGHLLTLKGKVVVVNALGTLSAENAFLRKDEEGQGRIDFPYLSLIDSVSFAFSNGALLTCQKVDIDYNASIAHFKGLPQIYYKDETGELFADTAEIEYSEREGKFVPEHISLHGNVQMAAAAAPEKNNTLAIQYALADHVDYFPEDKRMILQGEEGKRVLFYDRAKEMQLSARTVYASRGSGDGKESIQGVGDVCLVFKQEELEKLKKRFQWDQE